MPRKLRILMVAPEALPYARGGDLAEAVSAVATGLAGRFHRVDVLVPWAPRRVDVSVPPLQELCTLQVPVGGRTLSARVLTPSPPEANLRWLLLDVPDFFDRPELYGEGDQDFADNCSRYVALSRAACLLGAELKLRYDVLHAHDWTCALAPYFSREMRAAGGSGAARSSVFTFHTLAYQGQFWALDLPILGLGPEHYSPDRLEFFGKLSFLKGGLVAADRVTTVSPTYAREVFSPEGGSGLDGLFKSRAAAFTGILNGLDTARWDPSADKTLAATWTNPNSPKRETCCKALHAQVGLTRDDKPLFTLVASRLWAKATENVAAVGQELVSAGGRLLVLGEANAGVQASLAALADRNPGAVVLRPSYQEAQLRQAMAGSDFFLMPSRQEPCGLLQLIALRYGALPLVRRSGGLRDTVVDADAQPSVGTGIAYVGEGDVPLFGAITRALALFKDTARYKATQHRAAEADFSATSTAARYEQLFLDALAGEKPEPKA